MGAATMTKREADPATPFKIRRSLIDQGKLVAAMEHRTLKELFEEILGSALDERQRKGLEVLNAASRGDAAAQKPGGRKPAR